MQFLTEAAWSIISIQTLVILLNVTDSSGKSYKQYKYNVIKKTLSKHLDKVIVYIFCMLCTFAINVLLKTGCRLNHSSCTESHNWSTSAIADSLPAHCDVSFLRGWIWRDVSIVASCVCVESSCSRRESDCEGERSGQFVDECNWNWRTFKEKDIMMKTLFSPSLKM